jgi:acetyltransferase-like isoleucine patch superfamily enzyme
MRTIENKRATKPSTGATIPYTGFFNKLNQYVERIVGSTHYSRFFLQGFLFIFFKSMPTIFGSFLRGKLYRIVLGGLGHGGLIEKNVMFNIPKRIYLGDRVVIGESSVIDPRGAYGRIIIKNDVHIQRWCRLTTGGSKELPGELIIEDSVYIGPYSYIHAAGKIIISKDCLFGPRITLVAGNHNFKDQDTPIRLQGGIAKDILIQDDVWLSANVTVLGGVTIGKGSVIGAGSVVTRNIPPYSIAIGVPAKIIGRRE